MVIVFFVFFSFMDDLLTATTYDIMCLLYSNLNYLEMIKFYDALILAIV